MVILSVPCCYCLSTGSWVVWSQRNKLSLVWFYQIKCHNLVKNYGAPWGFFRRFEDGSYSMKANMKICSNLHWRMKMQRIQISDLLKNEDYQLPQMKIAFLKLLKTEDLKTPLKTVKKMKTMSCAESPNYLMENKIISFYPSSNTSETVITLCKPPVFFSAIPALYHYNSCEYYCINM